jgi:hypothetical protein
MISSLLPPGVTRDQLRAQIAALPPVPEDDLATAVANADLMRDDYAAAGLQFIDATAYGKKQRIVRYGLGAVCGLVVGVVACKLL